MPGRVPNTNNIRMSQDYQTRKLITKEGNLTGPICSRCYVHTHTSNARQPEPQLKSFSCSFAILSHNLRDAIPSHNLRDAILSHNLRNTTCLTPIPSHNSKDTFRATTQGTPASRPLRYPISLVDHTHQSKQKPLCFIVSPGVAH